MVLNSRHMSRSRHIMFVSLVCSGAVIVYALVCSLMSKPSETSNPGSRAGDTLKLVIVVSRHGNRRYMTIPNDPYPLNDTKLWPYGLGELTTVGRVQMYNLGVKIRELYNGFLNKTYCSRDFYAASTKIDRVMMSGDTFLAGLYPPSGFQVWNQDINWQPVPIYSDSKDKTVVMTERVCPRFTADQGTSVAQFMADKDNAHMVASIVNYLNPFIGLNQSGFLPMVAAWDTFISEETEGYILPSWVHKVYPEPMKTVMSKIYIAFFSGTDVMARLLMGSFYRDLVDIMKNKVNGTLSPDRKMIFYSGHDTSLIVLQYILGIPKASIVGMVAPGSAIMFELHQEPTNSQFYIKVLYIDGASANLEPVLHKIPDCGSPCDFDTLMNKTEKFYNITDYDAECQLNFTFNT